MDRHHYGKALTGAVQTWSMLLMNVWGAAERAVSTTYAIMVGKVDAKASVMMAPDADHVKISI